MESELGNWILPLIVFGLFGLLVYGITVAEPKRKKEHWLEDQIEKTKNKSYWDEWDERR